MLSPISLARYKIELGKIFLYEKKEEYWVIIDIYLSFIEICQIKIDISD